MSTPPPRRSSGRARWTPALRALSFFGALSLTLAAFNAWVVLSPTPTAQRGRVAMQSAMRLLTRSTGMVAAFHQSASDRAQKDTRAMPPARFRQRLDLPMDEAWPVERDWNAAEEREFARFVSVLGRARAEQRCQRMNDCLLNPRANTLFDASDQWLGVHLDCADVAYFLRAYFAYKRRLPFGYVNYVAGGGGDIRYMYNTRPASYKTWRDFRSPRRLLIHMGEQVHSGMFRMAPEVEGGDFYTIRVDRASVHPGTAFYDPDGHVLVVSAVNDDGMVEFIDGHPDGSFTHKRLARDFVAGSARFGGGFRNFRPQRWVNGRIVRATNAELADFNATMQYDPSLRTVNGRVTPYHEWVQGLLAAR